MRTVSCSRAIATAVVTPLLLLGLTACGGDDKKPTSVSVADDEPTTEVTDGATDEATEPAGDEGEVVEDPAGLFEDMQQAMKDAKTAKVAMDMGVGTARGQMSYGNGSPEMALVMDLGQQGLAGLEMRYVGDEMYMAMPGLTPEGKFFKFDSGSKTLGPVIDQMRNMTPDASAELMKRSLRKMTVAGTEEIDGEETTHYLLTIDTKEASKIAGEVGAPEDQVEGMPETLEYDMWVTKGDLMRRIVMNLMGITMQMDYSDWGQPVDIKKPAPKDIVKAPAGL